jgi:low temperature requirement protein LtrA
LLRSGDGTVTNVELFFDLVYVFAITQLSHVLVHQPSVDGAIQAAVLLGLVWQVWVYTTWMTNYLDPRRGSVRLLLLGLMLGSLVLAAALPEAFGERGLLVAAMYVAMQVGRCLFTIWALRGEVLQPVFWRVLPWSAVTGVVVLLGATLAHGHARELLWALAIAMDLIGAAIGFYLPGYGRSATGEWTITGGHFAERCQAFVLIALGESIVVTGTTLSDRHLDASVVLAFLVVFAGSVGLWWLYFDRAAEDSARVIAASADPGRLARNGFHWVHPLIVAGIIVAAAADDFVLDEPHARGQMATAWLILGGTALFLGGHAVFKAVVWRLVSWPRVLGVAVLAVLLLVAPHVSALALAILALAVIVAVAIADRIQHPEPEPATEPAPA